MFLLKSCKATAFDWDHHTLCVHNMWKYIIQLLNHVFPHDNLTWDASYVVNTYTKMFFWKSCKATWALEFSTKTFLYVYIFTKAVWMCTWCLLVSVGICWCLLESVGICWCLLVLVSVGVCWCLLVSVGVCWCLLVSVGVCWCLLVLYTPFGNGEGWGCLVCPLFDVHPSHYWTHACKCIYNDVFVEKL
jgi:hypothetical protein